MSTHERVRFALSNELGRPLELVTFHPNGTEYHWRVHHSLDVSPGGKVSDDETVAAHWGQCEWLVRSQYRESRCGRGGFDDGYGMTLCWQHQDKLFQHLLHRLQNKQWPPGHLSDLVDALVKAPWLPGPYSGLPPNKRLLEAQLVDSIECVLTDTDVVSDRVKDLIDRLIDRRLVERLGSDVDE